MAKYYTSDLHINHLNLIKRGFREFKDNEEMNQAIIDSMNILTPQDELYILGDLCMGSREACEVCTNLLKQIKAKIIVICGNHDTIKYLDKLKKEKVIQNWHRWKNIKDTIHGEEVSIALFHHPVIDYHNQQNPILCFHGHSHGMLKFTLPDLYDVGWDKLKGPKLASEIVGPNYKQYLNNLKNRF